jgi:hypothetical protein
MASGSVAHQILVFNLLTVLVRALASRPLLPLHEMRFRVSRSKRTDYH